MSNGRRYRPNKRGYAASKLFSWLTFVVIFPCIPFVIASVDLYLKNFAVYAPKEGLLKAAFSIGGECMALALAILGDALSEVTWTNKAQRTKGYIGIFLIFFTMFVSYFVVRDIVTGQGNQYIFLTQLSIGTFVMALIFGLCCKAVDVMAR